MKEAIGTILRLILKAGGGALAAKGVMDEGAVETIIGAIITIFGAVWGVIEAKKAAELRQTTTPPTDTPSPAKPLLFLIGGLLALGLVGCRSLAPGGAYQGDKVLFQAETTIVTSYELVDTFLKWERANEDLLALKWPEIHKAANRLRTDFPKWYATANALRDAYQVNPDPATRDKLTTTLTLLRTALTEAAGYMAKTTEPN